MQLPTIKGCFSSFPKKFAVFIRVGCLSETGTGNRPLAVLRVHECALEKDQRAGSDIHKHGSQKKFIKIKIVLGLLYLFFLHEWKTGEFFPSFEITKTSGSFIWYFKKILKIKKKLKINK